MILRILKLSKLTRLELRVSKNNTQRVLSPRAWTKQRLLPAQRHMHIGMQLNNSRLTKIGQSCFSTDVTEEEVNLQEQEMQDCYKQTLKQIDEVSTLKDMLENFTLERAKSNNLVFSIFMNKISEPTFSTHSEIKANYFAILSFIFDLRKNSALLNFKPQTIIKILAFVKRVYQAKEELVIEKDYDQFIPLRMWKTLQLAERRELIARGMIPMFDPEGFQRKLILLSNNLSQRNFYSSLQTVYIDNLATFLLINSAEQRRSVWSQLVHIQQLRTEFKQKLSKLKPSDWRYNRTLQLLIKTQTMIVRVCSLAASTRRRIWVEGTPTQILVFDYMQFQLSKLFAQNVVPQFADKAEDNDTIKSLVEKRQTIEGLPLILKLQILLLKIRSVDMFLCHQQEQEQKNKDKLTAYLAQEIQKQLQKYLDKQPSEFNSKWLLQLCNHLKWIHNNKSHEVKAVNQLMDKVKSLIISVVQKSDQNTQSIFTNMSLGSKLRTINTVYHKLEQEFIARTDKNKKKLQTNLVKLLCSALNDYRITSKTEIDLIHLVKLFYSIVKLNTNQQQTLLGFSQWIQIFQSLIQVYESQTELAPWKLYFAYAIALKSLGRQPDQAKWSVSLRHIEKVSKNALRVQQQFSRTTLMDKLKNYSELQNLDSNPLRVTSQYEQQEVPENDQQLDQERRQDVVEYESDSARQNPYKIIESEKCRILLNCLKNLLIQVSGSVGTDNAKAETKLQQPKKQHRTTSQQFFTNEKFEQQAAQFFETYTKRNLQDLVDVVLGYTLCFDQPTTVTMIIQSEAYRTIGRFKYRRDKVSVGLVVLQLLDCHFKTKSILAMREPHQAEVLVSKEISQRVAKIKSSISKSDIISIFKLCNMLNSYPWILGSPTIILANLLLYKDLYLMSAFITYTKGVYLKTRFSEQITLSRMAEHTKENMFFQRMFCNIYLDYVNDLYRASADGANQTNLKWITCQDALGNLIKAFATGRFCLHPHYYEQFAHKVGLCINLIYSSLLMNILSVETLPFDLGSINYYVKDTDNQLLNPGLVTSIHKILNIYINRRDNSKNLQHLKFTQHRTEGAEDFQEDNMLATMYLRAMLYHSQHNELPDRKDSPSEEASSEGYSAPVGMDKLIKIANKFFSKDISYLKTLKIDSIRVASIHIAHSWHHLKEKNNQLLQFIDQMGVQDSPSQSYARLRRDAMLLINSYNINGESEHVKSHILGLFHRLERQNNDEEIQIKTNTYQCLTRLFQRVKAKNLLTYTDIIKGQQKLEVIFDSIRSIAADSADPKINPTDQTSKLPSNLNSTQNATNQKATLSQLLKVSTKQVPQSPSKQRMINIGIKKEQQSWEQYNSASMRKENEKTHVKPFRLLANQARKQLKQEFKQPTKSKELKKQYSAPPASTRPNSTAKIFDYLYDSSGKKKPFSDK